MKTLAEATKGSKHTVHKIAGGKKQIKKMESIGIMSGSDIELLDILEMKKLLHILTASKELFISVEDAKYIKVIPQLVRGKNDPIFLGGCCAYGNTAAIWDRINEMNKEEESEHEI